MKTRRSSYLATAAEQPLPIAGIRWLLAAVFLASAACAPPPTPPVRLMEAREQVEAALPPEQETGPAPHWLPDAILADGFPATGRVAEIPMFRAGDDKTRDSRSALWAPPGSRYRFAIDVPAAPTLRLALGYPILPETVGQHLRFLARIDDDLGNTEVILERQLQIEATGGWTEVEIDLGRWRQQSVFLEFEVQGQTNPTSWGGWASPEIIDQRFESRGLDLILISLDTLRADRLGCYGYERRPTSPHLDELADSGVRFATAVSQAPWTRPSHRALFSGLYPASKGGLRSPPLARMLWHAGYRTGAITGGGQLDYRFGFHDGFESYRVEYWLDDLSSVERWLDDGDGRSNFLFLHTFDIHDPYDDTRFARGMPSGRIQGSFEHQDWLDWERRATKDEKAYIDAMYDGGIAQADEKIGDLLARLKARGSLDRTIIIVTSDHGEQLFDHYGWRHGSSVYDHQLLVPLIVYLPPGLRQQLESLSEGDPPGRPWTIEQQVMLIDVYPTVLSLLGVELPHTVQGRSLRPLLEGKSLEAQPAFSENVNLNSYEHKSLRSDRYKFIWQTPKGFEAHKRPEGYQLFDLAKDPREQVDLAGEHPDVTAALKARIEAIMRGQGDLEDEVPEELDPDLREKLRSLGYVD